eukprot:TRINITY_DN477_c0_g1_i9.p1 TRINITY_DN477_c0_g1~~TRINITY_DN477_c0_g1_i9.p1  ORF type:complete len:681 (+),score=148.56 TRINITY_DN477_c0_g1_i9:26-2044(+)
MRTTALFFYPVAAAARPVVLGCAFAGVLKDSWLYLLQAAVGMCSALVFAVLSELAQPVLQSGDDADGWVVICALPSVVWLAVRVEFIFCVAQLGLARHLPCRPFVIGLLVLLSLGGPFLIGIKSLYNGVTYGWLYLVCFLPQYATALMLCNDVNIRSPAGGMKMILLEFTLWTTVYYAFYDSYFQSFAMDSTWSFFYGLRVIIPVTMPVVLLVSLYPGRTRVTPAYNEIHPEEHIRESIFPRYDEAAESCDGLFESTDEEAALRDAADGVPLHLHLPNGELVPVELASDATLRVLRLRAAYALEIHDLGQVRLALCGETVAESNATPLRDVAGLEAGATVDVHIKPHLESSDPCDHMDLACREDNVQLARRALNWHEPFDLESMLESVVRNYMRYECRSVLNCALLEGNLASSALMVMHLLRTREESALRVIQESGVLDRDGLHGVSNAILVARWSEGGTGRHDRQEYLAFAVRCPGFLESTACHHSYIVMSVAQRNGFCGDYTALWGQLHEAGWRSTPSAVQQAGESQPSFFQINLLTIMLLADGMRVRDLPHVVRRLCLISLMLLQYACLAGAAIGVHATLGTQGADPTGGWLFVAFLCIASVTIAVELTPEWVRWLVVLKVCGTRTSQPPAGTQDVELVEELTEMEMPLLNQSSVSPAHAHPHRHVRSV